MKLFDLILEMPAEFDLTYRFSCDVIVHDNVPQVDFNNKLEKILVYRAKKTAKRLHKNVNEILVPNIDLSYLSFNEYMKSVFEEFTVVDLTPLSDLVPWKYQSIECTKELICILQAMKLN